MQTTNQIQAVKIDTDGTVDRITIDNGCRPLQELVGGWIEAIYSGDPTITLWGNDEAKLIGMEPNAVATAVWWLTTPEARGQDIICGPVVITGGADDEGDTLSLPEEFLDVVHMAKAMAS